MTSDYDGEICQQNRELDAVTSNWLLVIIDEKIVKRKEKEKLSGGQRGRWSLYLQGINS